MVGDILQRIRLPAGFFRSRKVQEFRDYPVQPIDLLDHDRGISLLLGLPVKALHKILGKSPNGTERVANLMRHTGGQPSERRQPLAAPHLSLKITDLTQILDQQDQPHLPSLFVPEWRRAEAEGNHTVRISPDIHLPLAHQPLLLRGTQNLPDPFPQNIGYSSAFQEFPAGTKDLN